ncbi:MAG: sugar phosphate isomerase/epimerase [Planctomycetaceae bacterium]|nr:sugar phosphate isomerase/epimerase [Planctomycetaceae bacterium]
MKFAICQELFVDWDWERQCRVIAETGYTGIEVAPFTLARSPSDVSAVERERMQRTAADHGLEIIGLHWLLAKTEGLHLTTADAATRQRTAAYLRDLADLCADLGGTVMVFGSPQQRNLEAGVSLEQAHEHAAEVFCAALPRLADRGVTLCMEPLTTHETNFCNTCAEAVELIKKIDHPNFLLHQDVKAMLSEATPVPELIRQFADVTAHFHANDSNLLGPGMGATDIVPIFDALKETNYSGWVSVEVFDYSPGAELIAENSLKNMQKAWAQVSGSKSRR